MAYYSKKETERQIQSETAGKGGNGDHEGEKGKKSHKVEEEAAQRFRLKLINGSQIPLLVFISASVLDLSQNRRHAVDFTLATCKEPARLPGLMGLDETPKKK